MRLFTFVFSIFMVFVGIITFGLLNNIYYSQINIDEKNNTLNKSQTYFGYLMVLNDVEEANRTDFENLVANIRLALNYEYGLEYNIEKHNISSVYDDQNLSKMEIQKKILSNTERCESDTKERTSFINTYGFRQLKSHDKDCVSIQFYLDEFFYAITTILKNLDEIRMIDKSFNKRNYDLKNLKLLHFFHQTIYNCIKTKKLFYIDHEEKEMVSLYDVCSMLLNYSKNKMAEVIDFRKFYTIKKIKLRKLTKCNDTINVTKQKDNNFLEMLRMQYEELKFVNLTIKEIVKQKKEIS